LQPQITLLLYFFISYNLVQYSKFILVEIKQFISIYKLNLTSAVKVCEILYIAGLMDILIYAAVHWFKKNH